MTEPSTQARAVLRIRVLLVKDALREIQRRCCGGYILFRPLFRLLHSVLDRLVSRGLLDAHAELTFVDLAELVELVRFAASDSSVRGYNPAKYWRALDPKSEGKDMHLLGIAGGELTSVDDIVAVIVLHPLRARFVQNVMARGLELFRWIIGDFGNWVDGEDFARDHRQQLRELVVKLQAQPLESVIYALKHRDGYGFHPSKTVTKELTRLVIASHGQHSRETELEREWKTLPRSTDPLAEYLLSYYQGDFADKMRMELGAWMFQPRLRVAGHDAWELQPGSRSSRTIPAEYLSVGAALHNRCVGLYRGKWLNSDVTIQVVSTEEEGDSATQQCLRFNHPNIVKLFGVSERGGTKLLVCEPMADNTLSLFLFPILTPRQQPPALVRWRKLLEIACGLQYLHNKGIVHGAVRASSVWLGRDLTAKLHCGSICDSRSARRQQEFVFRSLPHPRWSAPESLTTVQPVFSTKSDVFTLAKLIIETQVHVRQHEADHVVRQRVISGDLPNLISAFSDVQASLLRRMCSVVPKERPSIIEVEREFESAEFRPELCQYVHSMRMTHERNVFYGLLPTLSAIVPPTDEWVSLPGEAEALQSFRIGLAVSDGYAPESVTGDATYQASDVFELGILIATMVSGRSWRDLYPTFTPASVIGSSITNNALPATTNLFTEEEWGLIKRMCAFEPLARPSISTVVMELGEIVDKLTGVEHADAVEVSWDPIHLLLPHVGISIADALTGINELLIDQVTSDPRTAGTRWVLHRLQDIDRVLGLKTADDFRQVSLPMVQEYQYTVESLLDIVLETDSLCSFQSLQGSICATHRQIHVLHRFIDSFLNELPLLRSEVNSDLHNWRQQWELEQHSDVRRIVNAQVCEQVSVAKSTPSWFLPPHSVTSLHQVGSGGFGTAYYARWFDTPVVIKRVEIRNNRDRVHFQHEVDLWYPLNHPHVIQLFGACHVGDDPFFVCEHATNGRLDRYLNRDELKRAQVWKRLLEALLGLVYLHDNGIVHGDLKCDNILISADEKAKVADFGLSRDVQSHSTHNCNQEALGALQWRAPDVLRGEKPTFESDMFSFGMCIYQAVGSSIPWGSITHETKCSILDGKLPMKLDAFTDGQWELIQQMCCLEPSDRLCGKDVVTILLQIVEWNAMLETMFNS